MRGNFPSTSFFTLSDLDINLRRQAIEYNAALLSRLHRRTLTAIENAFSRAILVRMNGLCFVKTSELDNLLRTGSSGAANYLWQQGIDGYSSPATPHTLDGELYISGPDFCGLLDARIQSTIGKNNLYLKYVRAIYMALTSHSILNDLRTSFASDINEQRNQLKRQRIRRYGITRCEFTDVEFSDASEVQFAHVDSVATAPLHALDIKNGVIILRGIHAELTQRGIHDFAGMYDFCIERGHSTIWAEDFDL